MTGMLKRILLTVAVALAAVLNLGAQSFMGGGTGRGVVTPEKDSLALLELRHYLDSVRDATGRATVALVLSGGGAKGAAHVGVIKYLEENKVPVDLVVGTSVGGLVGGFYALGYDSNFLDSLIRNMDWDKALSDVIPREYKSYANIKYKERYALSFPFFYPQDAYQDQVEDNLKYSKEANRHGELHLGANPANNTSALVAGNLSSSLPSGLIFGQNVNNILNSLSVGYQDSLDFKKLPIPYVCVATDMVSGKTKVWYDGNISTAMRSTMSIPGLFAPVRLNGMVLVDGGMRDNYPADIARAAGADFIIGVDLNSGYKTYGTVNNLSDIISQGVDMLGREAYEYTSQIPDINIRPDIEGYGMLSFQKASIDTLIGRGYRAAVAMADEISVLSELVGNEYSRKEGIKATDIGTDYVWIRDVRVEGVNDKERRIILKKIGDITSHCVNKDDVENAVATIFGTDAFDYVHFALEGTEEPYDLVFKCKKGPIHQMGIGLRLDSEEVMSMLVNAGFNVHRLSGMSLDFEGKISANPYGRLTAGFRLSNGMSLNLSTMTRYSGKNQFGVGNDSFKVDFWNHRQEMYFSNINWTNVDVRLGVRSDMWIIKSFMSDHVVEDYNMSDFRHQYLAPFVSLKSDTFDDWYYPTKGFHLGLDGAVYYEDVTQSLDGFSTVQLDGRFVSRIGGKFAVLPSYNVRFIFGQDVPVGYVNAIGGNIPGRYLDQQIPFMGVNNAVATEKMLAIARLDLRYELFSNNYLSAVANVATSVKGIDYIQDLTQYTNYTGFGLEYAYNSIVGPLTANIHWSNTTRKVGVYLNLGFHF